MKAIMISIKPKYVAQILNGDKTIEIRKTMPKCDFPITVYLYCTKDKDLCYKTLRGDYDFDNWKVLPYDDTPKMILLLSKPFFVKTLTA